MLPLVKSIESALILGGVPVLKRVVSIPIERKYGDNPLDGLSPSGPSSNTSLPRNILLSIYVPVVKMTALAVYSFPLSVLTPKTCLSSCNKDTTVSSLTVRFSVFNDNCCK